MHRNLGAESERKGEVKKRSRIQGETGTMETLAWKKREKETDLQAHELQCLSYVVVKRVTVYKNLFVFFKSIK